MIVARTGVALGKQAVNDKQSVTQPSARGWIPKTNPEGDVPVSQAVNPRFIPDQHQGVMMAMPEFEATDLRADARRWVRKKRVLYTILGIYGVLSIMWFGIDMADGTESIWFYWP